MLLYELNNYVSSNVVYNDTLNPKIYDKDDNMRPEVHTSLIAVAKNFLADLDLPNMVVYDIVLTGSSANYNWTKFSDIDLHLISDVDVFADPHMAAKYFNAAKNVWNNKHDVDIRGLDVEVYIEDNDEEHVSLGRYSVMNNAWITKPDHNTPVFDEDAVNRKVRYLMKEIDMYMDDSDDINDIEHLKQKIWLMRNNALAKSRNNGTAGEFSVENLAFKVLRNMGYLDKILKALRGAEDRELSVRENKMKIQEITDSKRRITVTYDVHWDDKPQTKVLYDKGQSDEEAIKAVHGLVGGRNHRVERSLKEGRALGVREAFDQVEATIEFRLAVAAKAVNMLNALYKKEGVGAHAFLADKHTVEIDVDGGVFGGEVVDITDHVLDKLSGMYNNLDPIMSRRVTEDDWSVADAEDDWNDGISLAYHRNGLEGVEKFRAEMKAKGIEDPNAGAF